MAIANMLPQIMLSGNVGSAATLMSDLFKSGTRILERRGNATQTLFQGGTLLHRKRAADAALDQAAATYRSTVLTAFQNVADALHALDSDADALARRATRRTPRRRAWVSRVASSSSVRWVNWRCSAPSKPTSRRWSRWCRLEPIATAIPRRCSRRSAAPFRPERRASA